MYWEHDRGTTNRSGWKYSYKGSEVLAHAEALLAEYQEAETAARQAVADLMTDADVSVSDKRVEDAKREVERVARIHEECKVYVHEFRRNPDRDFNLALGDVVFFNFPASREPTDGESG
jgi:hypothetical protein